MEGDVGGGERETLNLKSTTATPLRVSSGEQENLDLDVSLNGVVHFGCVVLTSHSLLVPCDV